MDRVGRCTSTVGRTTLRQPDTMRLDMRMARVVRVGERVRVQAAVEAFMWPIM
jgi:hypothetical protein